MNFFANKVISFMEAGQPLSWAIKAVVDNYQLSEDTADLLWAAVVLKGAK